MILLQEYHALENHLARIDSARKSLGRALQTAIQGGASDSQDQSDLDQLDGLKRLVTRAHALDRIDKGIAQLEQERTLLVADGNTAAVAVVDQQLQLARAHRTRLQTAQTASAAQPHLSIDEIVQSLKYAIQQHKQSLSQQQSEPPQQPSTSSNTAALTASTTNAAAPAAATNAAPTPAAGATDNSAPASRVDSDSDRAAAPAPATDSAAPAASAAPTAEPPVSPSFTERLGVFESDLQRLRGQPRARESSGRSAEELVRLAEAGVRENEGILRRLRHRRS